MADSFQNHKAPILHRRVWGRKKYCWKICPYSTNAIDNRIPDAEKTIHTVTSGAMELDVKRGHDGTSFVCTDPSCSFFLGTATTPINIPIRSFKVVSGEYIPDFKNFEQMPCSGVQFWEF